MLEKLESFSFYDLDKFDSNFANLFFMYIIKEFVDVDESVEEATKILKIKLELVKIIDEKVTTKVYKNNGYASEIQLIYF